MNRRSRVGWFTIMVMVAALMAGAGTLQAAPVTFNLGTPATSLDGTTLNATDDLTVRAPVNGDDGYLINSGSTINSLATSDAAGGHTSWFDLNGFTLSNATGVVTLNSRLAVQNGVIHAGTNEIQIIANQGPDWSVTLAGSNGLRKKGSSIFSMRSATYAGDTVIEAGTLRPRNDALPNTSRVYVNAGTTLNTVDGETCGGLLDGATGAGSVQCSDSDTANRILTLAVAAGSTNAFRGNILPSGTAGHTLAKDGAGTQRLSGTLSMARSIEVKAGTLQLDGTVTSPGAYSKLPTNVVVKSGGTLAGTGTLHRAVVFEAGSAFHAALAAPNGMSVSHLTIGATVALRIDTLKSGTVLTYFANRTGEFESLYVHGVLRPGGTDLLQYGPAGGGGTVRLVVPPSGTVVMLR